jgi:hypothetical protein
VALCGCTSSGTSGSPTDADLRVWVTDLRDVAVDPDDAYDIAVAMSDPVRRPDLVVLDHAGPSTAAAVRSLAETFGRQPPRVVTADEIGALVDAIRDAGPGGVTIVSTGALTAIAGLLEEAPGLVRAKVTRVLVFAGDAAPGAPIEYNVTLDASAFVAVMGSGLPVAWVPCFDGGPWTAGSSSFVATSDARLQRGVPAEVATWLAARIGDRAGGRSLWAGPLTIGEPAGARWVRHTVRFNALGQRDDAGSVAATVDQLVVVDRPAFDEWMVSATNTALRRAHRPG